MLKKTAAIFLSVILLAAMAVPALAADDSLNEQLARVTQTVKQTLDIDNSYTQFSGDLTDQGSTSYWQLNWSNDKESLNVSADESGKVLSFYRYRNTDDSKYYYNNDYAPVFAKTNMDDALPAAKTFVEKVLGKNETASFDPYDSDFETSSADSFSFSGTVKLNGLKSPISFNVQVDTDDMSISRFYRSDSYDQFVGGVPSATATVSTDAASALLNGTAKLQLQYVLGEDGKTAVLQYLPVYTGNYIVEADSGDLVNLDDLGGGYYPMYGSGATRDAAAGETAKNNGGLSQVEQSTIASMDGLFSKEKLDAAVRAMSELGVDSDYALSSVNYSRNVDTGEVQSTLTYTKKISEKTAIKDRFPTAYSEMEKSGVIYPIGIYKYVTLDAFTGGLISIYSYTDNGDEENSKLKADKLQENAGAFLKKYFSDMNSVSTLNDSSSNADEGSFVFSQTENGILFPTNSASITVNAYDGTIDSFSLSWTDDVAFDSADGVVGADAAMATYLGCYATTLQYVSIPVESDTDYSYDYKLQLAYKLDSDTAVTGVDAKTGAAILQDNGDAAAPISYDDLEGCYGKTQIETLAKYGVGFPGTSFHPTAQLTQKDALTLLLSAVGFSAEDEDGLYQTAYSYNLVTSADRNPDKPMTRAALIKMLIGATEYSAAAQLKGIFSCGFADDGSISQEYYGYVAIAKGLGIVHGDQKNNFNPESTVTRQDAAIILYNFMSR